MTTENEEIEFNNQDENEEKVIEYRKPENFESVVDYTTKLSVSKVRSICFYTL